MENVEQRSEAADVTWIRSRESGDPAIRLEHRDHRHEASFDLELVGIASCGDDIDTPSTLPNWPPILASQQTLEVIQEAHQGRITCIIRSRSLAAKESRALASARKVWRNLRLALSGGGYRFAARAETRISVPVPGDWKAVIRPLGLELHSSIPIGYHRSVTDTTSLIRLPYPVATRKAYLNALIRAAEVCTASVQVLVSLQPVQIDSRIHNALVQALGDSGTSARMYYPGSKVEINDTELLRTSYRDLEVWSQCANAMRVECCVNAEDPVPETLLASIGAEVFGGQPVTWTAPVAVSAADVDLSALIPPGTPLPPCLPAAALLVRQGVPRHFRSIRPQLADSGTVLGALDDGQVVHFAAADRARHCYILGATGTGKSTLLQHLLIQDIERGAGICLIDPHGDLVQQVLERVPLCRIKDVVLIEPGDPERAMGLNFLECQGPRPQLAVNFITNEMIKIFDRLYDLNRTGGPIFEQYMRNALVLVMDNAKADGTLMDIPLLFEDASYRDSLLEGCRDPFTVSFWRRQAERAHGEASLENIAPYITCKLNQFTHNALLRPIIGQSKSTINFRCCMDSSRIVLVNLTKGILGELDARLLGMLIIGKLLNAALQRAQVPPEERRPFHLYVDEAHNFITDTVAQLLAEARKFGLYLTLANQNLAQVSQIRDAILGNVGSLLLFRTGTLDAEQMTSYVKPEVTMGDLQDLPDHHVVARLLAHGRPTRPFVFHTLAPCPVPYQTPAARRAIADLLADNQHQYTRPIAEIEAELRLRYQRPGL